MMMHCTQTSQQMEKLWLASLVGSLVVATVILETLQFGGLAFAADYRVNENIVTVPDTARWRAISSPISIPHTLETGVSICEDTPYLTGNRFILSKSANHGMTTLTAGLSLNTWKTALLNQATFGSTGKINPRMQILRTSAPSYDSTWHLINIRKTLPEFKRSKTYKSIATFIGPAQEFQDSPPTDGRSMAQTIPSIPPMDKSFALFGGHLLSPLNQVQDLQRLPNGESHRMNMTTAMALHDRDCASDCP